MCQLKCRGKQDEVSKVMDVFTLTININKLKDIYSNSHINVETFHHDTVE